jgi:hypothetical protein
MKKFIVLVDVIMNSDIKQIASNIAIQTVEANDVKEAEEISKKSVSLDDIIEFYNRYATSIYAYRFIEIK